MLLVPKLVLLVLVFVFLFVLALKIKKMQIKPWEFYIAT